MPHDVFTKRAAQSWSHRELIDDTRWVSICCFLRQPTGVKSRPLLGSLSVAPFTGHKHHGYSPQM